MNTEILGVILIYGAAVALALPLGRYIAKVFTGDKTLLDPIFNPLEKFFFRFSGIDPAKEMNWKQSLVALLTINAIWFVLSMLVLTNMSWLPLNPDGNPSMSADLAFNTSVSFVTNTNLQHYSGESGLSYLGQLILMLWQFISAGTGIAICAVVFIAMKERTAEKLGNFYNLLVKSSLRILLPLAMIVATILMFRGVPMTFNGKDTMISMQGDTMQEQQRPTRPRLDHMQFRTVGRFDAMMRDTLRWRQQGLQVLDLMGLDPVGLPSSQSGRYTSPDSNSANNFRRFRDLPELLSFPHVGRLVPEVGGR